MKIKLSKRQWNLLKIANLSLEDIDLLKTKFKVPEEDINFLKTLPVFMLQALINTITSSPTPIDVVTEMIQTLKQAKKEAFDQQAAPTVEQIEEMIAKVESQDPKHPAIDYFKDLKEQTMEINDMVTEKKHDDYQDIIDGLLDQFSKGQITQEQLQSSLKEFANKKHKMKIKLSKKQWNNIKTAQNDDFWQMMEQIVPESPGKFKPIIQLVLTPDGILTGKTKFHNNKLIQLLGKCEFNPYYADELNKKVWKLGEYFILIDGMGIEAYRDMLKNVGIQEYLANKDKYLDKYVYTRQLIKNKTAQNNDEVILDSGLKGWQDNLQNVYDSFDEFMAYNDTYGISERLGYDSPKECWDDNPMVQGGVKPGDFRKASKQKL